ncbi:hypothetical protein MVEN_01429800 [Mycena venus]|uniref:Mid2 domain-containing protein n=1 Tax=Mycena venus TaxID=2733690 RepID=A0A8H7CVP2_9AGAR|nr:hypothetical protein MVEN_01429800 [Mycena venus]
MAFSPVFSLCLCLLLSSSILAVLTNHTIDDAGPLVHYIPNTDGLCVGCAPTDQYDRSQLNNGTVTTYSVMDNVVRAIEMNFTGSAIYIFLAAASAPTDLNQQCGFALDGVQVGDPPLFFLKTPASTARYNILVYANKSIPDGAHTFQIQLSMNTVVNFDYAIYTSNDLETTSASSPTSTTSSPTSTASLPTSTASSPTSTASSPTSTSSPPVAGTPAPIPKKKLPVAVIAGGTIAGCALLGVLGTVLLCRRPRSREVSPSIEEAFLPPLGGAVTTPKEGTENGAHIAVVHEETSPGDQTTTALAAKVHALEAQVQQLMTDWTERRARTDSTAGSDVSLLAHSLSTMKREQTRVVRNHQEGYSGADALLHTDSGLRLTAGRIVDEFPPTYASETFATDPTETGQIEARDSCRHLRIPEGRHLDQNTQGANLSRTQKIRVVLQGTRDQTEHRASF